MPNRALFLLSGQEGFMSLLESHVIPGSYQFVVPSSKTNLVDITVIMFGGGGAGSANPDMTNRSGGSGGSGEMVILHLSLQSGLLVPFSVGQGGSIIPGAAKGNDGQDSNFGDIVAAGGKGGGPNQIPGGYATTQQQQQEIRFPGFCGQVGTQYTPLISRSALGGNGGGFGGGYIDYKPNSSTVIPTPPVPGYGGGGAGFSLSGAQNDTVVYASATDGGAGGVYIYKR